MISSASKDVYNNVSEQFSHILINKDWLNVLEIQSNKKSVIDPGNSNKLKTYADVVKGKNIRTEKTNGR